MSDNSSEIQPLEVEPKSTMQVLVVDDDQNVRTLNSMYIKTVEKTNVLTANSGQAGLELFQNLGGKLDLVISDNTMPGMKGEEMLGEIKKINPDVYAVLASGDADLEEKIESLLANGINIVLRKPTDGEQLEEVLKQARKWKEERERSKKR
jgi:DNA-binding NtrC family response regulator